MHTMFIGNGIKYYRGSGWAGDLWKRVKSLAKHPLVKSTGKILLHSAKQHAPLLVNTATNKLLEEAAKHNISDKTLNTLSGLSQTGLKALEKEVTKPDKSLSKTEANVSDFVTSQTGKLLAGLLAKQGTGISKLGAGVRMSSAKKGVGIKRLGGGLLVSEAPKTGEN